MVEVLTEQVAYLREQISEEREARRRADTIIAQLTQANAALASRLPQLEAPARGPGWVESYPEAPDRGAATEEQQTGSERPWWRRMFGG